MKKYIGIVLLLHLMSCKNEQKTSYSSDNKIQIDPTKKENIFNIDKSYISEVINLENTKNSLLGNVDKMLIKDDRIYILDKEISEAVYVFKNDGKFLYKIKRSGQGPGEYLAPDDFTIDKKTEELLILDSDQKKILYFKDSLFTHERKITQNLSFISYSDDSFVGITDYCEADKGQDCHSLFFFDKNFNILKKEEVFLYNPKKIEWDLKLPLFQSVNKTFYTKAFSNDIRVINETKIEKIIEIDFGKHQLSDKILNYDRQKLLNYLTKEKGVAFLVDNFMIDEKLIYFNFFYDQRLISAFVLPEDFEKKRLFSNISIMTKIPLTPLYMYDGFMYFLVDFPLTEDLNFIQQEQDDLSDSNPTLLKIKNDKIIHLLFDL